MRKIERTIYKFEELEKDIQEKLIEKEREYQRDSYCECFLYDDMEEKASDLINDYFGITSDYLKVYYDLSYCQGSGAMIEFDINIEDLNNKYNIYDEEEIKFIKDKGIINNITIRHSGNYYHERSFIIDYDFEYYWDYEDIKDDYNISEECFNSIENRFCDLMNHNFKEDIIDMNIELRIYGYSCLEYFWNCDDVEIIQFLTEDEYYIDGGVYLGVK